MTRRVEQIAEEAGQHQLDVLAAFHPRNPDPAGHGTLVLLGPAGPGFWPRFIRSPEYLDAAPDPMDRWSRRVIDRLADKFDARALFPFGQSPPLPFVSWALESGWFWQSPVGLLVHAQQGLWASMRGALLLPDRIDLPPPPTNPCLGCADKPCLSACPVGALSGDGYDLGACHAYLDSPAGSGCMSGGCKVRAACPISRQFGRNPDQSSHHMKAFHR